MSVEFTKNQISKFESAVKLIEDLKLPYCHCLNSEGGLWHATENSCIARLGITMYGLKPDYLNVLPAGIHPCLILDTRYFAVSLRE
jgi:alanine racemase